METRGIAIFDVCGTLTKTNNTSDFIEFVLRRNNLRRYGLFLLIRILSRLWRALAFRAPSGKDIWRERQIALLRGYSCDQMTEMARLYVNRLFTERLLNERVLEAMAQEKEQGRIICLVSAAIAPPIVEIAGRLGVETFCSSELEVADGRYTGRLRTDLLGHKESVLERIAPGADLQNSSVYSDNAEDTGFMMSFGRRTLVLNGSQAAKAGETGAGQFDYLVNPPTPPRYKDVHSVNERTVKWIYIPSLYYVISRFHREGLLSLLLREVIPVTLAGYLATHGDARALGLVPLAFWMFYAIYDIGGLVNDLFAAREASGVRTHRITPQVHIRTGLFASIRIVLVGLLSALLSFAGYPVWLFLGALALCLAVYFLHTLILSPLRLLTVLVLKICRISIPLIILAPCLPVATLVRLCAIFSALNVPWRVYVYGRGRKLLSATIPTWKIRCANMALLWVLGALVYAWGGSFCLLAIASYYAALEFPRIVHS